MATPRPALTTTSTPSEAIDEEGRAGVAQSQSWAKAGMGGNRTNRSRLYDSRFENQTRLPSSNNSELIFNNGNSAADLLSAYNIQSMQRSGNININGMATPKPSLGNNVMNQVGDSMRMPPAPRVPMRLSPTTGRTVTIGAGVDIARGFRLLEQSCARNKVRKDFTAQRFHERGGLKRKRMKRVRWRLRFMTGFKTAVSRVKHLKAQGW
jgi:small subunit ribosomal protein MRP21